MLSTRKGGLLVMVAFGDEVRELLSGGGKCLLLRSSAEAELDELRLAEAGPVTAICLLLARDEAEARLGIQEVLAGDQEDVEV